MDNLQTRARRPLLRDHLVSSLVERGLPPQELGWLVDAFLGDDRFEQQDTSEVVYSNGTPHYLKLGLAELRWASIVDRLHHGLAKHGDWADPFIDMTSALWWKRDKPGTSSGVREIPPTAIFSPAIVDAAWAECLRRRIDFTDAVTKARIIDAVHLVQLLETHALLRVDDVVRTAISAVPSFADCDEARPPGTSSADVSEARERPGSPLFWIWNDPDRFGRLFVPELQCAEGDLLGRLSLGFAAAFSRAVESARIYSWGLDPPERDVGYFTDPLTSSLRAKGDASVLRLLHRVFEVLEAKRRSVGFVPTWEFARAWAVCWFQVFGHGCCRDQAAHVQTGTGFGLEQIGRLRVHLREHFGHQYYGPMPRGWIEHMGLCAAMAMEGGQWGELVKRMLLNLRVLGEPSVLPDLRYWRETKRRHQVSGSIEPEVAQPPAVWSVIPRLIAITMHRAASALAESDPGLDRVRKELAEFCLERLSSKKAKATPSTPSTIKARNPREPDPAWRRAYVGALGELRAYPSAKAHQVLHVMIVENEEERPETRQEGRRVYDIIRHRSPLSPDTSPRVALFAAFLWMREAHLLALHSPVDVRGMQAVHRKEVRRTTDQFSWTSSE